MAPKGPRHSPRMQEHSRTAVLRLMWYARIAGIKVVMCLLGKVELAKLRFGVKDTLVAK